MKPLFHVVRMFVFLVFLLGMSTAFVSAQDIPDEEPEDTQSVDTRQAGYLPFPWVCHIYPKSQVSKWKPISLSTPVSGTKRIIYDGPASVGLTMGANVTHRLSAGVQVTKSILETTFGISMDYSSSQSQSYTFNVAQGKQARLRMMGYYKIVTFDYYCFDALHPIFNTREGTGKIFIYLGGAHIEQRCRNLGTADAWGAC